jgi:hypothetical protein
MSCVEEVLPLNVVLLVLSVLFKFMFELLFYILAVTSMQCRTDYKSTKQTYFYKHDLFHEPYLSGRQNCIA